MTQEPFDPYRKWLGIPPRDQPPNHYRLLGIEVFESDPDVISNAADGRMGQIRTFQTGRHSQWSQRLLNEVAAARVCLLNEAKKSAYDETLRKQFGGRNAPPVATSAGSPPPLAPPEIASRPSVVPKDVPSVSGSGPRYWQRPPILAAAVATAVVLIGLALLLLLSGGGPDVDTSAGMEPDPQVALQGNGEGVDGDVGLSSGPFPDNRMQGYPPAPPDPDWLGLGFQVKSPSSLDAVESAPDSPGPEPLPSPTIPPPEPDRRGLGDLMEPPIQSVPGEPAPEPTPPEPIPQPATPPAEPERRGLGDLMKPPNRSVPTESDQEAPRRRIHDIYHDNFDSLGTPESRLTLAAKLRQQGVETDEDPVTRFVFLKMAVDLAAAAADAQESFKAVAAIKQHYDADIPKMKADVLAEVLKSPRVGQTGTYLAQAASLLAEEAVARDDYKTADRLFNLAGVAARKANCKTMGGEMATRTREISRDARAYAPVEKSLGILANNPLDAEANGEVGRWLCFRKNDWPHGLTYLARGESRPLAELAQRDLAAQGKETNPSEQLQLGDGWWDLSGSARGVTGAAYMCRAVYWYQKALAGLSGLDKAATAERIDTAASERDVIRSRTWGAVEEGNVALATNGTRANGIATSAIRLLDGKSGGTIDYREYARGKCPSKWVIVFAKPYRLQEIRFKLSNINQHVFRYAVGTSPDGREFVPLADRSEGNWSSWQQFRFPSRLVKSVTIFGLFSITKNDFMVGEFEAYCIPPETPPGTAPP